MTEHDERRFTAIVVKLTDKRGQHLLDGELAVVAREIGAIAPILAPAKEEDLHAGLPAGLMRGNHIGVDDPWYMDLLMSLDQRQGADAITDQRCRLEIERLGRRLHLGRQPLLYVIAAA